jgi:electron transfer flavoprotein alpha subunit
MPRSVLVVGELRDGAPSAGTIELLGGASRLADGGEVAVTLLGAGATGAAGGCAGATRAFASDDPEYDAFRPDQWLPAIGVALDACDPDIVLIAQSSAGRDLGPRLAHRRGTAVAMDCVRIDDEAGALRATRPAYGGNAEATYTFATRPAIATVRARSFAAIESGIGPEAVEPLPAAGPARVRIVGRDRPEAGGLRLEDARIVISGGRGLGGPEGFALLEGLAGAIGAERAAVAASRAAVDLGWVAPDRQVGLTGKVVTPDLYLAAGISGASQHLAGCSGARVLVAVNRDEAAPIFAVARYGIVGDYREVIPAIEAAIRGR